LQVLLKSRFQTVDVAPGNESRNEHENAENQPENPSEFGALLGSHESRDDKTQTHQTIKD
jgi:hypothetical protein